MAKTDREPFTVVVEPTAPKPLAAKWIRIGYIAVAAFVVSLTIWGAAAPIESAAVAAGAVSLDTNKKLVQHLEGGIVDTVLVREGQTVAQDETLIKLNTTQVQARADQLKTKIRGLEQQLKYIEEELQTVERLFKQGQATKPRLLALQRRKSELESDLGENKTQLSVAESTILRSQIRAPVAGTVIDLKVHTKGGVIRAGDTLMAIVPKDEPLYIEAQIDPNDIDVVRPGLAAHVRLTPYSTRFVAPLAGKVTKVSADRMTDAKSNLNYYLARVELNQKPSEMDPTIKLYPGMPAEVIIVTGQRTMLGYLFAPITRSFRRAARED